MRDPDGIVERAAPWALAALVAAHAFALLLLPRLTSHETAVDLTWGFRHVLYLPASIVGITYGLAALAVLAAVPPVAARLGPLARRGLGPLLEGASDHERLTTLAIAALALTAFIVFDTKHALLGDAFRRPQNVEAHLILGHEAGAMHLLYVVYRALHATLGLDGRATIEIVSQLSGVVFVVATVQLARLLGRSRAEAVAIGAITLCMGSVQLFFGYVESYGPVYAMLALYLLAGVAYAQGRVSIIWALAAIGLAVFFHAAAVAFAPALAVAVAARHGWHRQRPSRRAGILAASCALLVCLGVAAWMGREAPAMILPLSPDPDYGTTLLSAAHVREAVNAQLLASGIGILLVIPLFAVAVRVRRLDGDVVFLSAAAGVALIEMFLFDARLGRADWDITALPSLAVQPLAGVLLVRLLGSGAAMTRLALPVLVLAALHTVPWIALNATDRAADRFADILMTDPGSYYIRQPGGLIAARTLDDNGLVPRALEAASRARDRHPDDPRCAYAHALLLARTGEPGEAAETLHDTVRRFPGYLPAYGLLSDLDEMTGAVDRSTETLVLLFRRYQQSPAQVLRAYPAEALTELLARLHARLLAREETGDGAPPPEEVASAISRLGGRPQP